MLAVGVLFHPTPAFGGDALVTPTRLGATDSTIILAEAKAPRVVGAVFWISIGFVWSEGDHELACTAGFEPGARLQHMLALNRSTVQISRLDYRLITVSRSPITALP